jgi:hypothetical protein
LILNNRTRGSIRITQSLGDNTLQVVRAHQLKELVPVPVTDNASEMPADPLGRMLRRCLRRSLSGSARLSVWASRHWVVRHIQHLYADGRAAGSNHAPVVVDLDLGARTAAEASLNRQSERTNRRGTPRGAAIGRPSYGGATRPGWSAGRLCGAITVSRLVALDNFDLPDEAGASL